MTLKLSRTALLIAAMATAVSLTALTPASAKTYWISADTQTAEVTPANFKHKFKKYKSHKKHGFKHHGYKHHSYKHHGFSKKKHVSKSKKFKRVIVKKKLF